MRRAWGLAVLTAALLALWSVPAWGQAHLSVVAGHDVPIENHPYQVRLTINSSVVLESECGGVIRDSTHVITAAHCATDELLLSRRPTAPRNVTVYFGSANTASQQAAGVSAVSVEPRYLAGDSTYDAALLTLAAPLPGYGGPTVNGIPFTTAPDLQAAIDAGGSAFATGFGATTENGGTSDRLQGVSLPLRPDSACEAKYPGEYAGARMVCAGGGSAAQNNPDTCQGDSGGPLALPTAAGYRLAGITSFGEGCGRRDTPGAYVDPSSADICPFLGGGSACSAATSAPSTSRDTTKPRLQITRIRCRKRRCTFSFRASDAGRVRSVSAQVARRARTCRRAGGKRTCRTRTLRRQLKVRRASRGFTAKATLKPHKYALAATARDRAGNRSGIARKKFRVRRR